MDINHLKYKLWADKRTLSAIEAIDRTAYADSYAFALQQLNHMLIVEDLFKSRLLDEPAPHQDTNTQVVPDFASLKARLIASGDWYLAFIDNCKSLEQSISFVFVDGKKGKMTVGEILFHIVNHGSYHRGNIAHALDLAGVPHPVDGYGLFIHEQQPERRYT